MNIKGNFNNKILLDIKRRKSKRLLNKEFEKMIKNNLKTRENSVRFFLKKFLINYKDNILKKEYIYLHDIEIFIGNEYQKINNKNNRNRDPKREIARFFNQDTNGYWDCIHIKDEKSKKYLFNPDLNKDIIRKTSGTYFTPEIKQKLLLRSKNRCELCFNNGTKKNLHADHWKNRSDGGNGTYNNGVILCQEYNNRKKNKTIEKLAIDYLRNIYKLNSRDPNYNKSFENFVNTLTNFI